MPTYQSLDLLRSLRGVKEGTAKENKDPPEKQKEISPPETVKNSTSPTESPPSPPLTPKAATAIPATQKEDNQPSSSEPTPLPTSTTPTTNPQTAQSLPSLPDSKPIPNPTPKSTSSPGPTLLEALSTPHPSTPPTTKSTIRQPRDMTDPEYLQHLGHNSMYDFMTIYDLKTWRHGDYEEARTILHALRDREQERVEESRKA